MTDSTDKESQPSPHTIDRRRFIRSLAVTTGLGAGGAVLLKRYSNSMDAEPQTSPPLEVPTFAGITPATELQPAIDWTTERVQTTIDQAIQQSLETGQETLIELPEGEILIDNTIICTVPEGARIKLKGHEKGSRLKLTPALSEISKEWGSFAKSSILYFRDMEGHLGIEGVEFDGSSPRAQQRRDHTAAKSPWDSLVLIVGKGDGDKYSPAMDQAGKRNGKAEVVNSRFYNSESGGVVMQNIHDAQFHDSQGSKLDVLFTSTWCDTVSSRNCRGEYFTSDGTYISSALHVELNNWQIKTARQAYDLQGVQNASLIQCHAYDSAFAFAFTLSETDNITPSGKITVRDSHSAGCLTPFSIGEVEQLQVSNSNHDAVGDWLTLYKQGDFHHTGGIVPLGNAVEQPSSFITYGSRSTDGIKLDNVAMRVSPDIPNNFNLVKLQGIHYTN